MRLSILVVLLLLAPAAIDQLDGDFTQGTTTNTNVTSNEVVLAGPPGNYSSSGTFLSRVFDLGSNPDVNISWTASSPAGAAVLVSSRSGPTVTPDGSWTGYSAAYTNPDEVTLQTNRYHQYRLQLSTADTSQTPAMGLVRFDYAPQGAIVQAGTNADIDEDTTGTFTFTVSVQDTVPITSVQARHRIGNESYNSYQAMTTINATHYSIGISRTWSSYPGEDLDVQVQVTNNDSQITTTTLTEVIDNINEAPVLASIADQQATEAEELSFSITASDGDGDNLTYSTTHGTITKFTNTIGDFAWTPQGADVGLVNVTVTVSDGTASDQETFTVNTTASNKPPTIRTLTDITLYYGQRVVFDVIVDDLNQDENITFSSVPATGLTELSDSNVSTVYIARANFSAFDNWKGSQQIFVRATDQTSLTDTENFTLTVNYCGDDVCQTQENVDTCSRDCTTVENSRRNFLALEFPGRMCTNQTITITAYNASSRYICYLDGQTTDDAAAWCDEIEGVDFQYYELNDTLRIDRGTASTNDDGIATFTANTPGRYRVLATAEDLVSAEELFTVRACDQDIANQNTIVRTQAPDIEAEPLPESRPRPERPEMTQETASLLSIFIWYMMIPLLLAGFIYTSNEYYDMYKDTDPKILAFRIKTEEIRQEYWPKLEPYWNKTQETFAPLWKILNSYVVTPVYESIIKPVLKYVKKR